MNLKKLSLVVLATLVVSCSKDDDSTDPSSASVIPASNENALVSIGVKGQVKTITTISYKAELKDGKYVKGKKSYEGVNTFDKKGLLIKTEVSRYSPEGNFSDALSFSYDDHNNVNLIKREEEGNKIETRVENTYESNKLIEMKNVFYKNSKKTDYEEKIKFTYLGNNISKKELHTNARAGEMELETRSIYKYNAKGFKIKEVKEMYYGEEKSTSTTTYEYDDKGLCIKETRVFESGYAGQPEETIVDIYSYDNFDKHGNPGLKTTKDKEGNPVIYDEMTYVYY